MKPIKEDAKILIRSYVDNIEDYLKSNSKMHPNEIDALLNEINDFIFIRSNELSSKDMILHSDVLKAIDECGSPSDILEQYLDTESDIKIGKTDIDLKSEVSKPIKTKKVFSPTSSGISPEDDTSYLSQLNHSWWFGFYRTLSLFVYIIFTLVIISIPFGYEYYYYYNNYIPLDEASYICYNFVTITLTWATIFVIMEGFFIPRWKNKLVSQGFNATKDNFIIALITRINYFVIILKTSLLPLPDYILIMLPISTIVLILMERQLTTNFWITNISPKMIKAAQSIEMEKKPPRFDSFKEGIIDEFKRIEKNYKIYFSILVFYFLFSFTFPSAYGWSYSGIPFGFLLTNNEFFIESLVVPLNLLVILTIFLVIGGIILTIPPQYVKIGFISTWLVRLIVFRAFLIMTSYREFTDYTPIMFFLFLLLLFYEFWSVPSFTHWIASVLTFLGQKGDQPISSPVITGSVSTVSEKKKPEVRTVPTQPITSTQAVISTAKEKEDSGFFPFIGRALTNIFSTLYAISLFILKPIYIICKAIFATILLLIGSFTEVVLLLFAVVTSLSLDGSFIVPIYNFDFGTGSIWWYGGFTIWSWYIIGVLVIQAFLLVIVEWYQYLTKKPEGFIVIFFRGISRVLLIILALGSFYQLGYGDSYAFLRLIILVILFFFTEITAFKVKIERKRWHKEDITESQNISNNETPNPN